MIIVPGMVIHFKLDQIWKGCGCRVRGRRDISILGITYQRQTVQDGDNPQVDGITTERIEQLNKSKKIE